MSHKIYRICLFMMVIAAVIGGIFYFVKLQKDHSEIPKEAVFVMAEPEMEMNNNTGSW